METKDLALLMLIPIILVGIIIYTDKNPVITGAVTAKQEESNVIGTYSINPSFKVKVDHDLEDYENIKKELESLIEKCKKEDIEQCLKDNAPISWNCPESKPESKEESLKILDDFVDKFNECLNLEEDGVVCRFSLDERDLMFLPLPQRIFEIALTDEGGGRINVELKQNKVTLAAEYIESDGLYYTNYDYRDTLSEKINPVSIFLIYENKNPNIQKIEGVDYNQNLIPLSKSFVFYKKNDIIKFVEFPGSSFEAPLPANKIIDLPKVKGIKFCANTGKQIYAYDSSDDTVNLRAIVYKFAVTYPSPLPPPPVKSLKSEDKLKAEKSIVLYWDKVKLEDGSDFLDFDHYNIYCSKNTLKDKDSNDIKLESIKPTMAVKSNMNYDKWIADINKCEKEDIQDGVDHYFVVTSVSKSGKESKAIAQATIRSTDDLAPGVQKIIILDSNNLREEKTSRACINLPVNGYIEVRFFSPEKNEDEITSISDGQLNYNLHFSKQSLFTDNLNDCSNPKQCTILTFVPKDELNTRELPLRMFNKDREIEDPANNNRFMEGEIYCFTVVAKDKNNNIIRTLTIPYQFKKPQQWLDLEAKSVIKGFFDEQGSIKYS